ncbi:hypothetical protein L484_018038 [Morus notabilis]|uniref:Retrovirus-related Pol polyprotein from transposon TNT 1-94 n=1 Tax=Morus notabilis TaxID=981085 RepID=W9S7R6_9ROSA|nr:hypothetical protein L484_018038 [Morus notabilis]
MEPNKRPSRSEESSPVDKERYQRLVCKLIYLSHTRPNIAYSVSVVSQHMNNPSEDHLEAVNRILRYLKMTPGHGLLFRKSENREVETYTDACWAGELTDRRSTTGYCSYVWGNVVTWRSKKQAVVSRSSAESEYRALALGICEGMWLQRLLRELKVEAQDSVKMFSDSQAAISIAKNPVHHDRTKHIEIDRHFFISEKVNNEIVQLSYVPTKLQIADVLTKALPRADGSYMFNLEGFIPKLCQLAQEVGGDERADNLRSAGLQTLSAMILFVWFIGENSHILVEFDNVGKMPETRTFGPGFASITIRRVLESLFRYFDNGNLWSPNNGLAFPVLKDIQFLMDSSGQNTHVLLSILVKHLDHKNVLKRPNMQLDIVQVTTFLAQQAKVEPSVAIIGAVSDIMRHLRKSIHCSLDDENLGEDVIKWNKSFGEVVDKCLVQLSYKVGEAGPILEVMAKKKEDISTITVIARTTISAVYRTAQIAFPETLFHQLLPAMVHPDHETRVGAHRIFSVVLVPCSVFLHSSPSILESKKGMDLPRTLSRTVSVFSSSAALFEKLRKEKFLSQENVFEDAQENFFSFDESRDTNIMSLKTLNSSYCRAYILKNLPEPLMTEEECTTISTKEPEANSLRLSSHQITLLLSSIWAQSISPANMPENYEAIAHTYSLVLLFSRAKNSSHEVLVRSFQLAFSLRSISLNDGEQTGCHRNLHRLLSRDFQFSQQSPQPYSFTHAMCHGSKLSFNATP